MNHEDEMEMKKQGWEFAHSLFTHLLIAHLLFCSDRPGQMSDCDRIAPIAQDN